MMDNEGGNMPILALAHGYIWAVAAVALPILYVTSTVIYNLYFHPLASYPGPFAARASRLWYIRALLKGTLHTEVLDLHRKYGSVVRLAPDELAYNDPDAWRDIYGYRPGKPETPKDPLFYNNTASGILSVLGAPGARHGELRRMLSHGFSERALRDQEPLILSYADLLISNLRRCSEGGTKPVNMEAWYNYFTFDVIGHLCFGESFRGLELALLHPWVAGIFENAKANAYLRSANYLTNYRSLTNWMIPKALMERRKKNAAYTVEKVDRRLNTKTDRIDLMSKMFDPASGLSRAEFIANSTTVIVAGSETTATLLAGVTYYLVKNPEILAKVTNEVRSTFKSEDEITMSRTNELKYLLACLEEALRMYPPVPGAFPRRTDRDDTICGKYVPAGTTVSVFQYAMYHTPKNFTSPDDFIPERWLEGSKLDGDCRSALQPFHVGPRNCLGRNLSYVEMRLAISKLLWNFDLEWTDACEGWTDQKVFLFWEKGPLPVLLKEAKR